MNIYLNFCSCFMVHGIRIGKNILVIGAGTSGIDIIHQLPKMASTRVTLSRRESPYDSTELRKILEEFFGCKLKGDVERFTSDDVEFKDGSRQSFEIVIFATGKLCHILFNAFCLILSFFGFKAINFRIHFWTKVLTLMLKINTLVHCTNKF